jgi:glycosyltransferase involved in cell wall biosynthesis
LKFLGEQHNVVDWISACDVFILSSTFEGFGLVVAEAMAALVIAEAVLEKFGGDSVQEVRRNFQSYIENLPFK